MQPNYIPPPVCTEIMPENKQLEQTSLNEETGTESCGEESKASLKHPQHSLCQNNGL